MQPEHHRTTTTAAESRHLCRTDDTSIPLLEQRSTPSTLKHRFSPLINERAHATRTAPHFAADSFHLCQLDGSLVNGFCLARKASVSETNLDTYPSDGSVPQELLDAVLNPQDPNNLRGRASSSYTNDRRESKAMDEDEVSSDEESSGDREPGKSPGRRRQGIYHRCVRGR